MNANLLLNSLLEQGYDSQLFNQKEVALSSVVDEVVFVALSYKTKQKPLVIIKSNAYEATQFYESLIQLVDEDICALFVPEESLRVEAIASSPENRAQTIEVLNRLSTQSVSIVVTSIGAAVRYLPSVETFNQSKVKLAVGNNYSIRELKEKLIKAGYKLCSRVDQPLTFSVRGGIVDVFSINYDHPIRIEFFDTEIDSIRYFDIQTQRTIKTIQQVEIVPSTCLLFTESQRADLAIIIDEQIKKNPSLNGVLSMDADYIRNHLPENHLYVYYSFFEEHCSVLDYLEKPTILILDYKRTVLSLKTLMEDTITYIQEMSAAKKMISRFSVFNTLEKILRDYQVIESDPFSKGEKTKLLEVFIPEGSLKFKLELIKQHQSRYKVLCIKSTEAQTILDELIELEYPYTIADKMFKPGLNLVFDELAQGFEFKDLYVAGNKELLFKKQKTGRYATKFKEASVLEDVQELNKKDYVVHNQYGIGQYMGLITKEFQGFHKDYLQIIYAENDELLVPIEQFHLIRKYASNNGLSVKLHTLGSNKWIKTKEKVQESVRELAKKLTDIYSQRKASIGYQYKADTAEQLKFENEFDYELTDDQTKAVIDVKRDMESSFPMDRLICGDVGFGKTEVAIRAAFKAVYEGKQVAFLCPTTVLAMQHAETFANRFKHFPVNIELLNRFVNPTKQKEVIKGISEGSVDIVIGTHRILSKDIKFKDLGLLVIDEEQRFGVEHKEKIKEMRVDVDVLSLSATPIPRTLQMSLIGMRQLSTLNTPPLNRLPVLTYVVEKSPGLIVEIIQRELLRNGQVFYLYNNIAHIHEITRSIKQQVENAKVGVVHGQMSKEEIEEVMIDFNLNIINVLVCTTIIETGLDIPNANTIIIENAHKFGLAQLYQIKGRVGRSSRLAYAYLLIPKDMQVSEVQEKRLKAIKEFTELGSGYKIAQRDLTIRGAGEILGPQQSGFIESVGIDLYLEMLKEAIDEEKGIVKKADPIRKTNMKIDNYIPEDYAPCDYEKIGVYKKIQLIDDLDELEDYEDFIRDRHGKMPKFVVNVFRKKEIDLLASANFVETFKETPVNTTIELTKDYSDHMDGVRLFELLNAISKNISLSYKHQQIIIIVPTSKNQLDVLIKVLRGSKGCLKK